MQNRLKLFVLVFFGLSHLAGADELVRPANCATDQARVRVALDEVYRQYQFRENSTIVAKLVALDKRVRAILQTRPSCASDDDGLGKGTDASIGVSIEHYSGRFWYSGRLLSEAHRLNPRSSQRSSTLYATVESPGNFSAWSSDVPDFKAARAYLDEFPRGPFAADAAMALASGYAQAYSARRMQVAQPGDVDKFACVAGSLGDLGGKTREQQMNYARALAEAYFRRSFRLRRPTPFTRDYYRQWREDPSPVFFYCPD